MARRGGSKPKCFFMGTTPRTTFGRAALLTQEGSFFTTQN